MTNKQQTPPSEFDDIPTVPYGIPIMDLVESPEGSTWRVEQDPLRLVRVS